MITVRIMLVPPIAQPRAATIVDRPVAVPKVVPKAAGRMRAVLIAARQTAGTRVIVRVAAIVRVRRHMRVVRKQSDRAYA